jgi:hypothetical protein
MTKRLLAALTCLFMITMSGCEFFAVPSASATLPVSTETTAAAPTNIFATEDATSDPDGTSTEFPTEEPTAPTSTPDMTEGMIFPDSDTKLIQWADLIALNADKLGFARNEIYARAGHKFTTKKYADYYGALAWYHADPSFKDSSFSDIQWANIHLIQAAEDVLAGKLYHVPSGTKLDYDQDGTLETLTYTATGGTKMTLKMKDGSTTTTWTIACENPSKKVYLGDIDYEDGMLDLFVDEAGPSDDYSVYVAGVKNNAFLQRGNVPGSVNSSSKKNPFKPDGKGVITTLMRMDIVATDFFIVKYKLNSSGKLVFSPQSSYDFISFSSDHYKAKTKVPIPLRASASSSSAVSLTVPADTDVEFVSTDGAKWIQIKAPAGTGWLELAAPLKLKEPNIQTLDAFDGLVMAD